MIVKLVNNFGGDEPIALDLDVSIDVEFGEGHQARAQSKKCKVRQPIEHDCAVWFCSAIADREGISVILNDLEVAG